MAKCLLLAIWLHLPRYCSFINVLKTCWCTLLGACKWILLQWVLDLRDTVVEQDKVKWYSSLCETHLGDTGHDLPYRITQCYMPPDTDECTLPGALDNECVLELLQKSGSCLWYEEKPHFLSPAYTAQFLHGMLGFWEFPKQEQFGLCFVYHQLLSVRCAAELLPQFLSMDFCLYSWEKWVHISSISVVLSVVLYGLGPL